MWVKQVIFIIHIFAFNKVLSRNDTSLNSGRSPPSVLLYSGLHKGHHTEVWKRAEISSTKDNPCLDEEQAVHMLEMGPWSPDDCHKALCIIIGIILFRSCPEASPCGDGEYLKLTSEKTGCCKCMPVPG
ncbi:uncharacterized protein [Clytia hemisphaerica]|uniref:Cnidarian restricted protein n=1 Tax=Clytia hemisphaerica TaxID=252671 RepID=A0A7M5UPH2_9CNID|eukprot:TCONS_00056435-protein